MPKYNKNNEFDEQQDSGLYAKDSLDNYNEDLSKKAVGSIFNNIERENNYNKPDEYITETIDTNFNISSDKQRQQLVKDLFDTTDIDVEPKRRPKASRTQAKQQKSVNTSYEHSHNQSQSNSAFERDDNTMHAKYVTRGNHQPVTPAMAARRKNVTMMESQRMPIITDEEIDAYKHQRNNQNKSNKHNNSQVDENKQEIAKHLENESIEKEKNFENTLHRLNEKNKHYHEIINSTNRRLNAITDDVVDDNIKTKNDEAFQEIVVSENNHINYNEFSNNKANDKSNYTNNINSDDNLSHDLYETLNISKEDLDSDFEDTIAKNAQTSRQPKHFIPKNSLDNYEDGKLINSYESKDADQDYYDLETDSYVPQKSKYSTGEVKRINDTLTTEVAIEDIDNFSFKDCNTADMEYLRKTIKEKSRAKKLQSIDSQFENFEKKHRNPNAPNNKKSNPQKRRTNKAPQNNKTNNNIDVENIEDNEYAEYQQDYNQVDKSYNKQAKNETSSKYDTSSNDFNDYIDNTDSFDAIYDTRSNTQTNFNTQRVSNYTSKYDTQFTSKIRTIDFDDDKYDYDNYQSKFNISLIVNIVLLVGVIGFSLYNLRKTSSLEKEITTLTATNSDLLEESTKVTELQMDLDYYKNLYEATEEGQQSLIDDGSTDSDSTTNIDTDSDNIDEGTSSGSSSTYTVQSGDTLSSISKDLYGSSNDYQKIIDANSLTSDSLTVGQVLVIPE